MSDTQPARLRRVLYIDDDPAFARLVEAHLACQGFAATIAADGPSGIELIRGGAFDLVVLDHDLPGMDGMATLELIRTLPAPPPVVFVAADSRMAAAALQAGAADYAVEGSSDEFLALLAHAVGRTADLVGLQRETQRAGHARLLAAAGHDLKQPLQVITLALDRIEMSVDAKLLPVLKRGNKAAATLSRAFDALLVAARYEAGKVTPQRERATLMPILEEVAEEWSAAAAEKGLSLRVVRCRRIVQTDPEMLEKILRNFVGNAVKYTDKGGIVIGCRRRGAFVEIQVVDSGIGIEGNFVTGLFEEFRPVDPARRGGLGLGLRVARRAADVLGHEISVRSRPGHGSCFAVRVPLVR